MIITIDGYSGAGKTTLAKQIAEHFNILRLDTGYYYRCVTKYMIDNNLSSMENHLQYVPNYDEDLVKSLDISDKVSYVAKQEYIRNFLNNKFREIVNSKDYVIDGRDIGTVVFPDAECKIFMETNIKERTIRRHKELGGHIEEIENNLSKRDTIDSSRKVAPLRKPKDALIIDNTSMTKKEQLELVITHIKNNIYNYEHITTERT